MKNAQKFTVPIVLGRFAADPSGAVAGAIYYNTTDNALKVFNGTDWEELASGMIAAANQNLSNLLAPTSINQDLLPDASETRNLGSFSSYWEATKSRIFQGQSFDAYSTLSPGQAFGTLDTNGSNTLRLRTLLSGASLSVSTIENSTGTLSLSTGLRDASSGATQNLFIRTGNIENALNADVTGNIVIQTGTTIGTGTRGEISLDALRINVNSQKIVNLTDPTDPQDAATKAYVDAAVAAVDLADYIRKDGTTPFDNDVYIKARNAADTADINIIKVDSNDKITLGGTLVPDPLGNSAYELGESTNLFAKVWTAEITNGTNFINITDGLIVDGNTNTSIDWINRTLTNTQNGVTVNWANGELYDQNGGVSVGWEGRLLVDQSAVSAADWDNRELFDAAGNQSLNWSDVDEILINNKRIGGLADPLSPQDAATKAYVDAVAEGLKPKQAVRAATTANITLSGLQTIDGVVLVDGDRVLVKDQTALSENGIYLASTAGWVRSADFDSLTPIDEINGAYTGVQEGTVNAGKFFVQTGTVAVLDTDPINFVFFNSAINYTAGDGLQLIGNEFSAKLDGTTLLNSANGLRVNSANFPVDFIPDNNSGRSLGSSSRRWNAFLNTTNISSLQFFSTSGTTLSATIRNSINEVSLGASIQHTIGAVVNAGEAVEYLIKIRNPVSGATGLYKIMVVCKTNAADSTLTVTFAETDLLNVEFLLTGAVGSQLRFIHTESSNVNILGISTTI